LKLIYSIGARFAGGGIGTTAYHAVCGLHRHRMLHRLLVGSYRPTEIPREKIRAMGLPSRALRKLATFDTSGWLWYIQSVLFDAWATLYLEPANLFHVWNNYGLGCLRRAKAMGIITIVERASSHPLCRARLLQKEYSRWGLTFRTPLVSLRRAVAEIEMADYVLIPSNFVRRSFLEEGFPEDRLLQAPFGVDTTRFRPADEQPRQLGWRDAELWLLGRISPEMKAILPSYWDVPGIRFVSYTPDPVAVFQSATVFAFPSIEEGSALVTYEALACGLPVVTTPNAGSVVQDGIEGFIVPIQDVGALAAALERLRADKRLRYGEALAGMLEQAARSRTMRD